jgi:ADP-ribose pyrophosphatase
MVIIEVNLKEGDKEPEQHLDAGEHIERVIVPLNELYDKLKGMFYPMNQRCEICQQS